MGQAVENSIEIQAFEACQYRIALGRVGRRSDWLVDHCLLHVTRKELGID